MWSLDTMLEQEELFVGRPVQTTTESNGGHTFSFAGRQARSLIEYGAANGDHAVLSSVMPIQPIFDPVTQTRLGGVRCLDPGSSLLRWLSRPKWEILETEDDSLLMTVVCPRWLGRVWEVFDADDNLVCTLTRKEIYDSWGYHRATLTVTGDQFVVRRRDQEVMGRISLESNGVSIHFTTAIADDPYSKMAVLAAALVHQQAVHCR